MAALRGVIQESWRLGLLDADQRDRLCDTPPIRSTRLPAGRALDDAELERLLAAAGVRDRALVRVLAWGGLRREEAATLRTADVATADELVRLTVAGKGGKQRVVYLAGAAAADLLALLPAAGDPLFGLASGGAVWKVVRRLANRAGVSNVSPHDLRRTFTSRALDAGIDLATVQHAMGHADPRTTSRYDRRADAALIAAARALT